MTQKNPDWEEIKAKKIEELAGFRDSDQYRHEERLLLDGLNALHPEFIDQCSDIVAQAIAQVSVGKPVSELDRATKTNIGPAIERKFLERFGLPQLEATEKIDTRIGGVLIDVKTTIGRNWMIHQSCIGKWCLLFREDCEAMTFDLGITFITADMLNRPNDDRKSSISRAGMDNIVWVTRGQPLVEIKGDMAYEITAMRYEIKSLRETVHELVTALKAA